MKTHFNFRHVVEALGLPSTNKNNWAVGQHLRRIAAQNNIEPQRLLSKKTSKDPSVNAPHCLAHYPIEMLGLAVHEVSQQMAGNTDPKQQTLFDINQYIQ